MFIYTLAALAKQQKNAENERQGKGNRQSKKHDTGRPPLCTRALLVKQSKREQSPRYPAAGGYDRELQAQTKRLFPPFVDARKVGLRRRTTVTATKGNPVVDGPG